MTDRIERPPDRRDFLEVFRDRLEQVIADSGVTRSAFARSVGMDRSTLSQLLAPGNDRLPRVESLVAIAAIRRVSLDWLLGLSEEGHLGADIVREQTSIERNALSPTDSRLISWHREAIGYKIRYVPSTLPDLLKTEAVIRYELGHSTAIRPEQTISTAAARLEYQRRPETDMEACTSTQAVAGFAWGEGIWHGLPHQARIEQLDLMIDLTRELYPTFRWFLFDGLERYSAAMTIFGPRRAALYIGQMYYVFNSTEHIRALADHFDDLIRGASVPPTDIPRYLADLRRDVVLRQGPVGPEALPSGG